MSKIIKTTYNIKVEKEITNIKIVLLSDIHVSTIFKRENFLLILEEIQKEKPDYVCISGDFIDSANILENKTNEYDSITFLKNMSRISKVIISLGNHDLSYLLKNNFKTKWQEKNSYSFFDKISKIKNIYLLDNKMYSDNNINFIGFTPSFDYYRNKGENVDTLIDEMNAIFFKIDEKKYNILLCHSPIHILDTKVLKEAKMMKNIDLILAGHMHNGMVHPLLAKIWLSNRGIISPNKKIFPKVTRGILKKNNKVLIISGGITKLSYSTPNFFHPFNSLFPMNIEIINIMK